MTFDVGDTVQLKSGGPDMTVTRIGASGGEPMVWCVWFEGAKDVYALFPPEALQAPSKPVERPRPASEPSEVLSEPSEVLKTPPAPKATPEPLPTEANSELAGPEPVEVSLDAHPAHADSTYPGKENDKSLEAQIASMQAFLTSWIKRP